MRILIERKFHCCFKPCVVLPGSSAYVMDLLWSVLTFMLQTIASSYFTHWVLFLYCHKPIIYIVFPTPSPSIIFIHIMCDVSHVTCRMFVPVCQLCCHSLLGSRKSSCFVCRAHLVTAAVIMYDLFSIGLTIQFVAFR